MNKRLKIIVLQIFLEVFREPFLLLTPLLAIPTYIFLNVSGIGHLLLILPVARWINNYIHDTPEHRKDVRELEEFLDKLKKD